MQTIRYFPPQFVYQAEEKLHIPDMAIFCRYFDFCQHIFFLDFLYSYFRKRARTLDPRVAFSFRC